MAPLPSIQCVNCFPNLFERKVVGIGLGESLNPGMTLIVLLLEFWQDFFSERLRLQRLLRWCCPT
jgi:hypothetical protein